MWVITEIRQVTTCVIIFTLTTNENFIFSAAKQLAFAHWTIEQICFKVEQSSYLFSLKNSRLCPDLNPGLPRYQADMLPIELSWLGYLQNLLLVATHSVFSKVILTGRDEKCSSFERQCALTMSAI